MSDGSQTPEGTPAENAPNPAEANLSATEQEALRVAREGLPPVNPNSKPDNRPQRPESVPEKFWDAEKGEVRLDAMAQSYAELEARFSGKPEEAEEGEGEDNDVDVKNGKISKKADAASEEEAEENPVATSIAAAAAEFSAEGKFTEETSTKLAELGIPPEVQSVYLAGLEALQAQQTATVQGYVGGEEQYNAMARWAGQNLSDAELEAFNNALDNPALAENAVTGLYARYTKARPSEGRKVAPKNGATDGSDVFGSRAELTQAMSDPRYKTDVKYQAEVMQKMARTRAQGVSFNR